MSVPEGARSKPKLEVIVRAMGLAAYTLHICSNTKIFKVEYNNLLTQDLVHCAKEIYADVWKANNINANRSDDLRELRFSYQTKAILSCYEMLSLIQLSKPVYHLTAKRVKYWGKLTRDLLRLIQAWKTSDSKRYLK